MKPERKVLRNQYIQSNLNKDAAISAISPQILKPRGAGIMNGSMRGFSQFYQSDDREAQESTMEVNQAQEETPRLAKNMYHQRDRFNETHKSDLESTLH